jgi:hypothetical protein
LYGGLFFKYREKLVSFGNEISTKDALEIEKAMEVWMCKEVLPVAR